MKNRLTAGAGSAVEATTVPAHVRDGYGFLKGKLRQAALSLQRSEIQIHMFFSFIFLRVAPRSETVGNGVEWHIG
jgi:hypothetical protein